MSDQTPLNPDAQTRRDIMAGQIGAWMDEWDVAPLGTLTAHMATHVANRLAENGVTTLAVAQPVAPMSEGERLVRELHSKEPARYYGTDLNPNNKFDCSCCGEGRPWPCPTIRTLDAAQPVVNSVDPRELNRRGWTCGCEPGNYDSCDECQSACNELANFLNRPEVDDA